MFILVLFDVPQYSFAARLDVERRGMIAFDGMPAWF
jgi:hypothetical protein